MTHSRTLDVGMDVHTDSIAVAYVAQDHPAEVVSLGNSGTRPCDLDHLLRRLQSKSPHLVCVYAAGPCGSWRSRALTHKGHGCWVVAPAVLPTQPGARVTTNRRDASTRARLMRSGDLTPVSVPQGAEEAMRDLCRAREDAIRELQTAQCRLQAVLLRQDIRDTGRATWGPAPLRWLSAVGCPTPAQPLVLQAYVRAVTEHTARRQRLAQALHAQVHTWRLQPVVEALQGLRGVPCTVASTRGADLGDLTRVDNPRPLMRELGRIPSASSRGDRRRQGGITKAGNTHARRVLIAGAWADRSPATGSRPLQGRLATRPQPLQDSSGKAHGRLGTRARRLIGRGKNPHPVVVAIARELRAFLGASAREVPLTPETETGASPASVGPRL